MTEPYVRIVDDFSPARRSPSAEMVAALRAAHQSLDDPVIHADPLALRVLGDEGRRWLEENPKLLQAPYVRDIRAMVVIRSRLCEDELERAAARGTRQFVLLGAGLDTFAYRQPAWARDLVIYEVDEPSTQAWKRERLAAAGIDGPDNLRFVPVDFNTGTLADALATAGFDRQAPAFFAWPGVSYYLPRASIDDTLRYVAGQAAATEIVFDIALDEPAVPEPQRAQYRQLRNAMAGASEPWQTWLDPAELSATLNGMGFDEVEAIDSNTLIERYRSERQDLSVIAMVVARKSGAGGTSRQDPAWRLSRPTSRR